MSDYFADELLIDAVIMLLEHELAAIFLPNERKVIGDYLHKHPNASINEILEIVYTLNKNQEKIKLSQEQLERIKRHYQNFKNLQADARFLPWLETGTSQNKIKSKTKPSEDDYLVIKEAENKLLNQKIITQELTPLEIKLALYYFRFYAAELLSVADKANIALLGVINVRIPGGIRPVVLHSWGNLLNVPDVNAAHESPDGGQMIDRGNRMAIINAIKVGNLNKDFLQKLPKLDLEISDQSPRTQQLQMEKNE